MLLIFKYFCRSWEKPYIERTVNLGLQMDFRATEVVYNNFSEWIPLEQGDYSFITLSKMSKTQKLKIKTQCYKQRLFLSLCRVTTLHFLNEHLSRAHSTAVLIYESWWDSGVWTRGTDITWKEHFHKVWFSGCSVLQKRVLLSSAIGKHSAKQSSIGFLTVVL